MSEKTKGFLLFLLIALLVFSYWGLKGYSGSWLYWITGWENG